MKWHIMFGLVWYVLWFIALLVLTFGFALGMYISTRILPFVVLCAFVPWLVSGVATAIRINEK